MSFSDSIVLKNAAAANVTMSRISDDATKSNYLDVASTLSAPRTLSLGHQMSTSPNGVDRHLIKLTKTALDGTSKPQTLTTNLTLNVPRLGIVRTDVDDLVAMLKEFLVIANMDKLVRGEL